MQTMVTTYCLNKRRKLHFGALLLLLFLTVSNFGFASNTNVAGPHYLRGKVYHSQTRRVLAGVSMKISNGHATTTDSEGYFALNLDIGEKYKPGTTLTIYLLDELHGNDVVELAVPYDLGRDVRIEFKSNRYFVLSGTVIDKGSQKLLGGVTLQATPQQQGLLVKPPEPVTSDKMGNFWITFDREEYGEFDYVKLNASYPDEGKYEDFLNLEQMRNGIVVQMEPLKSAGPITLPPSSAPSNENGTLCITNATNGLVKVTVHKRHPKDAMMYEQGEQISEKIGPGESPCFDFLPSGPYVIVHLDATKNFRVEVETYSANISAGKTSKVTIR